MRILITNVQLDHRTGTEIVVRDVEHGLRRRGHDVCVYTPRPGVISDEIAARGGTVVDALERVPFVPDVIHAHHNVPATEAALQFPTTPLVFVCHDARFVYDMARGVPSVHEFVAVDLNCRERLEAEGADRNSVHVITNAVDLDRFVTRGPVLVPPRRAAVFGNNAVDGGFVESVRTACARAGLSLDEFGSGVRRTLDNPERHLANYDVVFAKARCAIEALAAGCAVVAVDEAGYGGLVTSADIDWMLDWNVGDRCLQRAHDAALIDDDLQRIDVDDVRRVSEIVRTRCSLTAALDAYERVYLLAIDASRLSTQQAAVSWRDPYYAALGYATELEARLRGGDWAFAMPPLPPATAEAIDVSVVSAPRLVAPGEAFEIRTEVINRSRESLASVGTTPVHLAYQWLNVTGDMHTHDGRRTLLTRAMRPLDRHRQRMVVDAPDDTGRYTLRVTLVQESVMWFSELPTPAFSDVAVTVSVARESWTLADIAALCGLTVTRDARVTTLGFVSSPCEGMLAFAVTESVLAAAVQHGCRALIVPHDLVPLVPEHLGVIASDMPADAFRRLHGALATSTDFYGTDVESRIHPGARVHPTAAIDAHNVRIADGAVVGAGCVINGRATLGRRVEIGPGAVIGASGFQTIRSGERWQELVHAGGVNIGDDAIVFANATVARGLFRQDTIVGESCRIGNNAVVSHNVRLGCRTTVGHGAIVNGNVDVGEEVWIGPGASVANNIRIGDCARVDLGGVVIGNLPPGEHVGGPPAIDHHAMLREVARWRSGRRR